MTLVAKPYSINKANTSGLFVYLLLLTALFFLMQVSFFFEFSGFYMADFKGIANHLKIPSKVIPSVLFYVGIQLALHLLFAIGVWLEARLIGKALSYPWKKIEKLALILWCLSICAVVLANQVFYPHSLFSALSENILSQGVAKFLLDVLLVVLSVAFFISLVGLFRTVKTAHLIISSIVLMLLIGFAWHYSPPNIVTLDASSKEQPNIILIGIDALRPDFTGFFGYAKQSPHLDDFFNHATVFSESLTPIARTFPAWVSILLGKYPKQSGIRTDLQDQSHFDYHDALPMILREKGYETIFATDETRFSNIDERFGFDKVIVPTMGLNDFLLGTLNDFPLSNLLVNTSFGRRFFPDSYGNRPAFATYDPDSFLNLLKPVLSKPRQKPVFLAVHFCLTHFPYIWDESPIKQKPLQNYQAAIHRVDQQFADYLTLLQKNKLLDHAIVIVLSDHGEAIELHGDRATDPELYIPGKNNQQRIIPKFYPASSESETVDESAGHGTDVLGLTQYHNVLAVRLFGVEQYEPHIVSGLVSLLDIKPTILDFLKIQLTDPAGFSLRNAIVTNQSALPFDQDFFTESDFSPEAIRTAHPEVRKAVFEGIAYFQIDPKTARFTVRKSMEQMIISSKQYADFKGDWVLALYPQKNQTMTPILVNLQTGEWTDDLTDAFALQSPALAMLASMKKFFGNDISAVSFSK